MSFLTWVFIVALLLSTLYWLASALMIVRIVRRVPLLERLNPPDPGRWPRVSVIIPACNEAQGIDAAMRERLREDYPDLELILVEDRSTDDTPAIVDRLAGEDARLRVLHLTELPDGWLGKVHAMHRGRHEATGEWILFSDADVHIAPGTLRRVIAYCEHRGLDHLAVLPELWSSTFVLDTMLACFIRILCVSCRLWAVDNPKSRAAAGVGAFNLVRRSALDRAGGLEPLRLTVVDDMGLGQLLKRSGARSAAINGRGFVKLHFYRSVMEMGRGAEKTIYVVFKFNLLRLITLNLLFLWLETGPFWGILAGPTWLGLGAAAVAALAIGANMLINAWVNRPLLPAVLIPVGSTLNAIMTARAGVLAWRRGGSLWRGTLYRNDALRAARQFDFP